ncbi:MAG: putative transrane anti-sigma factor [Gemmatimonadetes bacterium]|jgi:anti-sigma factor (TIGR02949 family)|nr:putative transrane anti-sigma factor [Gemmatimonadota bacterium]
MRCAECRDKLDAYLDDELAPSDAEVIAAHVAECPDCAREYAALAATSRRLEEGLVHYQAPDVLRARILSAMAQPRTSARAPSWAQWTRLAAAAVVIAAASSALTVATLHRGVGSPRSPVADEILASHVRSLMPGHLTDVTSNDQHNVKPWFNGRVDLSPPVPRLDSAGFPLLGGRLDYVASRPVAAVVYGRRQHIINVFSWPSAGDERLQAAISSKGYHLVHWRTGQVESWVVSDLNASELSQFVALFRRASE